MFVVKTYDDGGVTLGYERGDVVPLKKRIDRTTLNGDVFKSWPIGTKVRIRGKRDNLVGDWLLTRYWVEFPDQGRDSVYAWDLGGSEGDDFDPSSFKGPPVLYVVRWHEGAMWKHSHVVAWSPQEAADKLRDHLATMRKEDALERITINPGVPHDVWQHCDDQTFMTALGI